jgi:hypothetical protein
VRDAARAGGTRQGGPPALSEGMHAVERQPLLHPFLYFGGALGMPTDWFY